MKKLWAIPFLALPFAPMAQCAPPTPTCESVVLVRQTTTEYAMTRHCSNLTGSTYTAQVVQVCDSNVERKSARHYYDGGPLVVTQTCPINGTKSYGIRYELR